MTAQQRVSRQLHEGLVGQSMRVLVEKRNGRGWVGRSAADAPEIDGTVKVRGRSAVGEFAQVEITGASEYDLHGRCVNTEQDE
jgi:ribosomal protein S12 methylthiotransferase